ncbi:MAG TPA: tyrosine-protein phosphatase [Candidatus Limnocylindrales bacterium]|nr:tyrosine-protein phosphatase [Candidatus Limnocylindrales bacterium]
MIDSTSSRAVTWDGCVNVRDLGGLPTEDGGTTQPGRIIRSDNVGVLTPAGWQSVAEHGVVRIVDLRWPEEIADDPPRDSDIEVVNVSVLGGSMHGEPEWWRELNRNADAVDDIADHYAWSYVEFLERNRDAFGRALGAVAGADGPVVIHCMGGKDRTGLVSALLLRLAGVSLDVIGEDYSLSGPILMATRGEWLTDAPTEAERKRREKLSQTPADGMRRVVATIEERYGSVEGYLAAAGVTPAQLDALHARLR